jgi:acetyl-CoA acetyltransferase
MLAVENACASSSTAFHLAHLAVESGAYDVVVAVGAEKMTHEDRARAGRALATAIDVEARRASGRSAEEGPSGGPVGKPRPVFMEIYASKARRYMRDSGATARDFALVAAKSSRNGSLNPIAQVQRALSVEDVLGARVIVEPLTRPMCAGIGDGAAAIVLCSEDFARRRGLTGPRVVASVLGSAGPDGDEVVHRTVQLAYHTAGIEPVDLDLVEVHDAAAPAELMLAEVLGLAAVGDGPRLIRDGDSEIGGKLPINPSGGLLSRGHPIGATGLAQIVELADQLRGRAGARQIGGAQLAMSQNAGGSMFDQEAACAVTILAR